MQFRGFIVDSNCRKFGCLGHRLSIEIDLFGQHCRPMLNYLTVTTTVNRPKLCDPHTACSSSPSYSVLKLRLPLAQFLGRSIQQFFNHIFRGHIS